MDNMQKLFRCIVMTALVGAASAASADELKLTMANGRVTLIATDVPLRVILAEWARVGQTRIVNGEKVVGPNLTLVLEDVPEGEVLEVLLRSVAGYMAAPREAASPGVSFYDRIVILPTSRAPAVTASAPQPQFRPMPQPQPMPIEDDDGDPREQGIVPPPGMMPPGMQNFVPQPGQTLPPGFPGFPGQQSQPIQQTAPKPGMLPPAPVQQPNPFSPIVRPGTQQPTKPGGGGVER
jgi:hypothetical protein